MTVEAGEIQPLDDDVSRDVNTPFIATVAADPGTDRIALVMLDLYFPPESISDLSISADSADLPGATFYAKFVGALDAIVLSAAICVAVPDDYAGENIDIAITLTTPQTTTVQVSSCALVFTGALDADANMDNGFDSVERSSFDSTPLPLSVGLVSAGDMAVAVAGAFRNGSASLTFNGQSAETALNVNIGGDLGTGVTSLGLLEGAFDGDITVVSPEDPGAYPYAGMGFVLSSADGPPLTPPGVGASATNFNCECECGPANKTLAAYRRDLLIRCGFAAIANNPPPGTTELMNAFLSDAQSFLYKKYPALHTKRFFRWTMTEGQRFYGILENDDSTQPRIPVSFAAGTGNAVEVTWAGYAAPPANRGIFFTAIEGETLPYGILPNTMYFVVGAASGVSNLALIPGGTAITITPDTGTEGTSHGYAEIRQAIFNLEPYADIEGAWLVDLNGSWLPMTCGIPPTFYTTVSQPGLPVRYEIRSCIEVFPAPAAAYSLYIKGHFGLRPFELDSDKPTIDGHLVYLWALANALDYYGKPSAAGIATQAQDYLGQLVAGTHTGKRYVPGMRPLPPAIIPIFAPWPGGDP